MVTIEQTLQSVLEEDYPDFCKTLPLGMATKASLQKFGWTQITLDQLNRLSDFMSAKLEDVVQMYREEGQKMEALAHEAMAA